MAKYKNLVLGIFAIVAPIVAYLYQVDPLSLCQPSLSIPPGAVSQPLTTDAGN